MVGPLKAVLALFCGVLAFLTGWFASTPVVPRTSSCDPGVVTIATPPSTTTSRAVERTPLLATVIVKEEDDAMVASRGGKGYRMERERSNLPLVVEEVFGMLHHPASPAASEIVMYKPEKSLPFQSYSTSCTEMFLSRTGSLANMPNKCLALSFLKSEHADPIPHIVRKGLIAKLQDMFSRDFSDAHALHEEAKILPSFLAHLDELTIQLRALVGDQDAVIVMVLNTGVVDLFLNFLCSCRSAGILPQVLARLVVFTAQTELEPVLHSMGVKVFASNHLGAIPSRAAGAYGDTVFGMLMWLKNCAVFVAAQAGYNVLFQDVDMVWLDDPVPSLLNEFESEVIFMDDGARSPRFSPYYFNSGFYLVRRTERSQFLLARMLLSVTEIVRTHSHQSTLTKVLLEASEITPLSWTILDQEVYASGYLFHHDLDFIDKMKRFEKLPKVFHMCWTESRTQKVDYLKKMGLWMLAEEQQCLDADAMRQIPGNVVERCCNAGSYFTERAQHFLK